MYTHVRIEERKKKDEIVHCLFLLFVDIRKGGESCAM
jgi:hypothetical protein